MKTARTARALAAAVLPVLLTCLAVPASAQACPAGTQCVYKKLLVQDPGSGTGNQFLVEDKAGAPMFWVNLFGAQSGGEPVCTTDLRLNPVICLGAGRFGQYGSTPSVVMYAAGGTAPQVLSYQDVVYLHSLETAGVTPAMIKRAFIFARAHGG